MRALLPDLRANPGSAVVGIASINAILGNAANPAKKGKCKGYGKGKGKGYGKGKGDREGPADDI